MVLRPGEAGLFTFWREGGLFTFWRERRVCLRPDWEWRVCLHGPGRTRAALVGGVTSTGGVMGDRGCDGRPGV